MMKNISFLILLLIQPSLAISRSAPWYGNDVDGIPCRGNPQGYGPYDYTVPSERKKMEIVESRHFTHVVENLISGEGHVGQGSSTVEELPIDLDYTIRAIPNHHRALLSIVRYQLQFNLKKFKVPLPTSVECYMQRAIHFSPNDAGTYSLFAFYLRKAKHYDKAIEYYEKAIKIDPKSAKIVYGYSLLLLDMKKNEEAVAMAKKAYELGNPPKKLRKKLIKLGIWN